MFDSVSAAHSELLGCIATFADSALTLVAPLRIPCEECGRTHHPTGDRRCLRDDKSDFVHGNAYLPSSRSLSDDEYIADLGENHRARHRRPR
jgi:hypothetical protein